MESSSQSRRRRGTSIPIPLADSSIHRNVAAMLIKVQLTESKEGGVGGSGAGVGDKEFGWSTGEEEEGGCQAPKKCSLSLETIKPHHIQQHHLHSRGLS